MRVRIPPGVFMFTLTKDQQSKLSIWKSDQDKKIAEMQKRPEEGPYYGASGGAYTYSFTPTTLGCCKVVTNSVTNESIDLSDYENW